MHRQQNTAILHAAFIPLGFILRNAKSDECSDEAAHSAAHTETRERTHAGACCDERTNAGNRQRDQQADADDRDQDLRGQAAVDLDQKEMAGE